MKKIICICLLIFTINTAIAAEISKVKITGNSYLGISGNSVQIQLDNHTCHVSSKGEAKDDNFIIEFKCNGVTQILWDINKPVEGDFSFDEPQFELLWAGDKDNDGKIDIEMNMSPKYSCSKKVTYLSTKSKKGQLVGITGTPKTICGH